MKHLVFHFDVISPFAYLAFERLPQALEGISHSVDYQPVLFAGLLAHWGQKGPAEIEPKRAWTFRHVWCGGADANDPARLAALTARLAPERDPQGDPVKQALKSATSQAIAKGVFGVPTIEVDGRLFWGFDAVDMVAAYLGGDAWFDGPAWDAAATAPPGVHRKATSGKP